MYFVIYINDFSVKLVLFRLYSSHLRTRLTLQEAFELRKQRFIFRSKQRLQDVKDLRLEEKRHQNTRKEKLKSYVISNNGLYNLQS